MVAIPIFSAVYWLVTPLIHTTIELADGAPLYSPGILGAWAKVRLGWHALLVVPVAGYLCVGLPQFSQSQQQRHKSTRVMVIKN